MLGKDHPGSHYQVFESEIPASGIGIETQAPDTASVSGWVDEMRKLGKESSFLLFKKRVEMKGFQVHDFVQIIMSPVQRHFLLKFGHDRVCIEL